MSRTTKSTLSLKQLIIITVKIHLYDSVQDVSDSNQSNNRNPLIPLSSSTKQTFDNWDSIVYQFYVMSFYYKWL